MTTPRLAQLTKLYEMDPRDPFCAYAIALEHLKTDQTTEALSWLDKTLGLDAMYCYAYYQKGKVLAKLGQGDQAKAVLTEGIAAARRSTAPDAAKALSELQALRDTMA